MELNEHKDKLDSAYNKLKEDYKKVWNEREKLSKERSKAELENRRLKATLNVLYILIIINRKLKRLIIKQYLIVV